MSITFELLTQLMQADKAAMESSKCIEDSRARRRFQAMIQDRLALIADFLTEEELILSNDMAHAVESIGIDIDQIADKHQDPS